MVLRVSDDFNNTKLSIRKQNLQKMRLVEEKMCYEDLISLNNFDGNEQTSEYISQCKKDQEATRALLNVRKLDTVVAQFKDVTLNGLGTVLKTIKKIDEMSQKMLLQPFDGTQANELSQKRPVYKS